MFSKSFNATRRAFTLIEIMIVVLIIGILLAIAVPNFVRARESARSKACISNLKQIQSAKEQWAMDNKKAGTETPATTAIYGSGNYILVRPTCPSTNANYTENAVDANPTCATVGTAPNLHALPTP
jgi:prepilin-type N-terminal cleavage/methylation domain-containing protein